MNLFVFRNNTVERFFSKDCTFSGYDDISVIPQETDGYVWFYQLPVKFNETILCEEIHDFINKIALVIQGIQKEKPIYLITIDDCFSVPMTNGLALQEAINHYNTSLFSFQKSNPNVYVLDICEFTRHYKDEELIDWKFWFLTQMGMNPKLAKPFIEWFTHKLDQISLRRKKCLVLDLDNTLWGGILGEDGIDGLQVHGDYPGKAFHLFQEALLELAKNGVILTICSKNNEDEALQALEKNPFMVLNKEHFSCWRINWKDKATNIREISEELNIGLDSMVFIDDSPSEREWVRQTLPMVAVPDFPPHPYDFPPFIKGLTDKYFRVFTITQEDKKKTEQYKANALRVQSQRSFTDLDSFIQSLDIHIFIESADDFNIPRIAQMTQKTNQFNLTTKRYSESDIRSGIHSGWQVFCMSVSDRFGDNGITGCIIINGRFIDSFLLSCRVLGKNIEFAIMKSILNLLKRKGFQSINAQFSPTVKNKQVEDFYDKCGFSLVNKDSSGAKLYKIDLTNADLTVKPIYHIVFKNE